LFLFISVAELSTTLEEREIQYTKILQAADGKMDKQVYFSALKSNQFLIRWSGLLNQKF